MPRFFVEEKNITQDKIFIEGEDVNHIKNVLRLKSGEEIILCDGRGKDYIGVLEEFEKDMVSISIKGVKNCITEPPVLVTLFQGIPKADKMSFVIQKSVELGVNRIVPVITERTVVRFNSKKDISRKLSRWQRISVEAAKQCNRGIIPVVESPVFFVDAIKMSKADDLSIIPYEKHYEQGLKYYLGSGALEQISVFIGPEGGFSKEEVDKAVRSDVKPVSLGPRILRTETASICVLSIIMYEAGCIEK